MVGADRYERPRQAKVDNVRGRYAAGADVNARFGWGVDEAGEIERKRLGDALGVHDPEVIGPLYAAGLRSETTVLLEWLPAIEVAWIDDVDAHERGELSRQFSEDPRTGTVGVALLTEWLFVRPPHEAMIAARRALRHRLDASDAVSGREMRDRIVSRCEAVGRTTGGLFGLGALSWNESDRIDVIREALGDESHLPPSEPIEFPH